MRRSCALTNFHWNHIMSVGVKLVKYCMRIEMCRMVLLYADPLTSWICPGLQHTHLRSRRPPTPHTLHHHPHHQQPEGHQPKVHHHQREVRPRPQNLISRKVVGREDTVFWPFPFIGKCGNPKKEKPCVSNLGNIVLEAFLMYRCQLFQTGGKGSYHGGYGACGLYHQRLTQGVARSKLRS